MDTVRWVGIAERLGGAWVGGTRRAGAGWSDEPCGGDRVGAGRAERTEWTVVVSENGLPGGAKPGTIHTTGSGRGIESP